MHFFEIVPAVERLKITLPSEAQTKKFVTCLSKFSGMTAIELLNELSAKLNSKSVGVILDAAFGTPFGDQICIKHSSISKALAPADPYNLSSDACLEFLRARFQKQKTEVLCIIEQFQNFVLASSSGHGAADVIEFLIDEFGYSRIAIKKLLLSLFVSINTSASDTERLQAMLRAGQFNHRAKQVFFLAESLRPRGRPFSSWSSYDEPINITAEHYQKSPVLMDGTCPVPIFEAHIQSYLNGLLGASLPDQVAGLKALLTVSSYRNWKFYRDSKRILGNELCMLLEQEIEVAKQKDLFANILGENHSSFTVHTSAVAFPDLGNATLLRNETDRLTLPRLVTFDCPTKQQSLKHISPQSKSAMMLALSDTDVADECLHFGLFSDNNLELAHLLRFLKYRENLPHAMDICGDALALVLATGVPAKCFTTHNEIEKFIAQRVFELDYLGAMLWSSVLINGRLSDDADYLFLRSVERFVIEDHDGDIVKAFTTLAEQHPSVVVSLVNALSPRRIQKCYLLVSSYPEVNATHRKLLEVAAKITGDVELIMQADQIILDEKLASVRAHIDSSRIYVEEVLFHNWIVENIWPQLEALRKQVFLIIPGDRENLTTAEIAALLEGGTDLLGRISAVIQEVYLNDRLVVSYETFCRDHYFGVDSFLGRRIRHNATHGILLGQLDEISQRSISQNEQDEWDIRAVYSEWKDNYNLIVEDLVNNLFRFKSEDHPRGLLSTKTDLDSEKFQSMATDVIAQVITGSPVEVVLRALTSGCWGMLDPELKKIRSYLRSEFTKTTMQSLDEVFRNSSLPCQALQAELKAILLERIERLSSWFSPFNPSETALSLHHLSRLIWTESETSASLEDLEITGNAREAIVVGGQSRILYDCLHVLLVNAAKHSSGYQNVSLSFESENLNQSASSELSVTVLSHLSKFPEQASDNFEKYLKMKRVLFDEESSKKSLIVHGYSGLRKLRYLMYRMDRENKITLEWSEDTVSVGFSIPIEFARNLDEI